MFQLETTYASLPDILYRPAKALPVSAPRFVMVNQKLAKEIGLKPDWLLQAETLSLLSGSSESSAIAMAYAGHQFGHFVPSLGDGRAYLLGEIVGPDGVRRVDSRMISS